MKSFDDKQLVSEFKAGKVEMFDELVNRHSRIIYQTVFGLLHDHHDAEEVVQDAFMRAFRGLKNFRGDANFGTWLHRIAVNLARNKYHWNRRRGSEVNLSIQALADNPDGNGEELPLPDERYKPGAALEKKEEMQELMQNMNELSDSLRETMVLRHVHNMPYEKIAEIQKCRTGTVKSRIARGREILRNVLKVREK
jgi:RNA polymerase sigma-70 factor (ECF subfamily)